MIKSFCTLLLLIFLSYSNAQSTFDQDQLLGKKEATLIGDSYLLLPEAAKAFEKMKEAALQDQINIKVVSSFRSYERQRSIWNRKYRKNKKEGLSPNENINTIIEYSTIPGTSRHHWGTEIDIVDGSIEPKGDVLLTEKFHHGGPYEKLRRWLEENAERFGFICAYPDLENRKGFYYEPWHYSYAPISIPLYRSYLKLDLKKALSDMDLEGSDYLDTDFLEGYRESHVKGINPLLK